MRSRRVGWVGVLIVMAGTSVPVWSAEEASPSYPEGVLRKLGRGVANIITCPFELIRTPELVGRTEGNIAALTKGIAVGAWRTVVRGVVGVVETVTFFVEIPKDFQPILQPEFVYSHGDWVE